MQWNDDSRYGRRVRRVEHRASTVITGRTFEKPCPTREIDSTIALQAATTERGTSTCSIKILFHEIHGTQWHTRLTSSSPSRCENMHTSCVYPWGSNIPCISCAPAATPRPPPERTPKPEPRSPCAVCLWPCATAPQLVSTDFTYMHCHTV